MTEPEASPLSEHIGRRLRQLRGEVSAQRLAEEAAAMGFPWNRSTVANIENGRRDLSAAEIFALPLMLLAATGEHVRLIDLVAGTHEAVSLSERIKLKPSGFRKLLAGEEIVPRGYKPLKIREAMETVEGWKAREKRPQKNRRS